MSYVAQRIAEINREVEARARQREKVRAALSHEKKLREEMADPSPKIGVVYFIKSGDKVKIGFTRDIDGRLAPLQSGNPHEMRLLGTIPATDDTEAFFHQMFAAQRVVGEWFKIAGPLDAFLSALPENARLRKRGKKRQSVVSGEIDL